MNIFEIIKNLFTNPKSKWILDLNDEDIKPVIIQRFLCLHPTSMKQARFLNSFVYTLPPKMYLSAAWTLLFFDNKKLSKAPFIQYPKKETVHERYHFIFDKVKRHFNMSDRDLEVNKKFIVQAVKKDPVGWFSFYGIENTYWSLFNLDINDAKKYCDRPKFKSKEHLDAWL